jgi:hypothetical protein
MKFRHVLPAALALCAYVAPGVAIAHGGAEPWIHVPAQSIQPGQPFELWGSDLGESASVAVEIVAGEQAIEVGRVTAEVDGHFTQTLTLPTGVPDGYAQLHAESDAGVEAFMWVLVGQSTTDAINPSAPGGTQWWSDPSVIVLGGILGAALVAALYLALRAGRRAPGTATAAASPPRPVPRKGSRKARRRNG